MANHNRVIEGSIDSVLFWREVLIAHLGAKPKKANSTLSAMRVETYTIPIIGNPRYPQSVTMRVELDERIDRGRIKLGSGCELLEWQSRIDTLCRCCTHGKKLGKLLLCTELMAESGRKIRSCKKYQYRG